MKELIQMEQVGSTSILTLNRPERHNSLIPELLEQLLARIDDVQARPDTRAVILQANGRSFSTGGDVSGFYKHLDTLEAYARQIVGLLNQVILSLLNLPVPTLAAVHGIVTGGSLGLVLASDIVLVAPEASFTPYYSVGNEQRPACSKIRVSRPNRRWPGDWQIKSWRAIEFDRRRSR